MQSEPPSIQIALTPRFKRDLSDLSKRYRSIRTDLQPLIDRLQLGETPGDEIIGSRDKVFKVRLKNNNIQKGKSGGYRVIYYVKTEIQTILVTIYSKSDFSDVSNETIEDAIDRYKQEIQLVDDSET